MPCIIRTISLLEISSLYATSELILELLPDGKREVYVINANHASLVI